MIIILSWKCWHNLYLLYPYKSHLVDYFMCISQCCPSSFSGHSLQFMIIYFHTLSPSLITDHLSSTPLPRLICLELDGSISMAHSPVEQRPACLQGFAGTLATPVYTWYPVPRFLQAPSSLSSVPQLFISLVLGLHCPYFFYTQSYYLSWLLVNVFSSP